MEVYLSSRFFITLKSEYILFSVSLTDNVLLEGHNIADNVPIEGYIPIEGYSKSYVVLLSSFFP